MSNKSNKLQRLFALDTVLTNNADTTGEDLVYLYLAQYLNQYGAKRLKRDGTSGAGGRLYFIFFFKNEANLSATSNAQLQQKIYLSNSGGNAHFFTLLIVIIHISFFLYKPDGLEVQSLLLDPENLGNVFCYVFCLTTQQVISTDKFPVYSEENVPFSLLAHLRYLKTQPVYLR